MVECTALPNAAFCDFYEQRRGKSLMINVDVKMLLPTFFLNSLFSFIGSLFEFIKFQVNRFIKF